MDLRVFGAVHWIYLAITVPLKGICRMAKSTAAKENWYTQKVAVSLPAGIFS